MTAREYAEKIMRQMEVDGLTQGEVERVLEILPKAIKVNEERLRKEKPFIVKDGPVYF